MKTYRSFENITDDAPIFTVSQGHEYTGGNLKSDAIVNHLGFDSIEIDEGLDCRKEVYC